MPRRPLRDRAASLRQRRGWPSAGQIGLAIVVGLVIAIFIGALTRHDGSKAAVPSAATTSSAAPATVTTARVPETRVPVKPTTTSVAEKPPTPTTRAPRAVARTTTTAPLGPHLVPLTIATPTHEGSYSRATDFGGWIDVDGCQNTRAAVLIRTTEAPVTFTTASNCTVKSGRWTDPWSGAVATVAHDFQIDHTVPLANAWRSGAWSWTHDQRVAYANDLADKDHLVAILASENEAKGDSGPEEWRPPTLAAWCRYALDWDRIKAKWHLSATPAEWTALEQMVANC